MDSKHVGVIGLGLMGTAISERLLAAGYRVSVWNRTWEKAAPLLAAGAAWSDNPLADCGRVVVCLYTSDVVASVLDQLGGALRPGQVLVDTTTGDPVQTAALGARLAERGVAYLDAPVSGSSEQTRRGEATVIVGGPVEAFDACRDLFAVLSQKVFHVGPWGSGARMKLVTNLVLGLNRAALAEGLVFAASLGLPPEDALAVLKDSAAYSRQMDTKGRKMVEGDFTTQAKLTQHLKDVRLILHAAAAGGLSLPLTQRHRELLEKAEAAGFGEADNSAIIRAYDRSKHHTSANATT
jgi:3-hydroxyisobutyrate dehydrogenase-like beta-hydroxyacid dehydrogenase